VRIAATRELLDRLIGKPQISIDAVTTKVDVGALYLEALRRSQAGGSDMSDEKRPSLEMTPGSFPVLPGNSKNGE